MNFTFLALNLAFAALFAASARVLLGRGTNPFVWTFVLMNLVFVYGLPVQEYSTHIGPDILLLSHLLMFAYLLTVLLVAGSVGGRLKNRVDYCVGVSGTAIGLTILSWLAVRAYLVYQYGPGALLLVRAQLLESLDLPILSSVDAALASMTTLLLLGAFAAVTIRHASRTSDLSLPGVGAVLLMLPLIVVTNESPIGSRRLILVLALLWVAVAWAQSGRSIRTWLRRRGGRVALAGTILIILATYYQLVRQNDLSDVLQAKTPSEVVSGIVKFATTLESAVDDPEIDYLRSGPLDFFASVVSVVLTEGKSSNGAATALSLAISVPRALFPGEKPVGDVDQVLEQFLGIYPDKPYLFIDYSTSLPAIAVADFGPLAVIPAALLLGLSFATFGRALQWVKQIPLALLVLFGLGVQLAGSQEAGLTSLVSAMRDCGLAAFLLMGGHVVFRLLVRSAKTISRRAAHGAASSAGWASRASG